MSFNAVSYISYHIAIHDTNKYTIRFKGGDIMASRAPMEGITYKQVAAAEARAEVEARLVQARYVK
jgi:hypothetical protein